MNVYIELSDCNHIQSQNLSVVSNFVVEFDFYATSIFVMADNGFVLMVDGVWEEVDE